MFGLKQSETKLGAGAKAVTWGILRRRKAVGSPRIRLSVKNPAGAHALSPACHDNLCGTKRLL